VSLNFQLTSAVQTHVGMVRESNQDNFVNLPNDGLFLVADGMGGRAGGEIASEIACEVIKTNYLENLTLLNQGSSSEVRSALTKIVNAACLKIYERSLEIPHLKGMGTTCTLLSICSTSGRALVGHVGDSRCYLLRKGFLFKITEDHSLVNEQVKVGVLKRNDPLISQMRNVITRCVGYQEEEEVDTIALAVEPHDVFLLCSDGLTNKVRDTELAHYMGQENLPHSAVRLVDLANARGGEDNCTVVMVLVGQNSTEE
jgi:PPM family protein phosphatase